MQVKKSSYYTAKYGWRRRSTPVVIDVGKANGAYPGAEFFLVDDAQVASGTVTQLDNVTCTLLFKQDADSDYDRPPKVGWKLSTKAP